MITDHSKWSMYVTEKTESRNELYQYSDGSYTTLMIDYSGNLVPVPQNMP